MPLRFTLFALLLIALTACGDPQQRALTELTERGYALSVAEYHRAAGKGDVEVLDAFLRAGTQIDVPDAKGETALSQAIRGKQAAAAEFLAQKGARLTARDGSAETFLRLAARSGELRLISLVAAAHTPEQAAAAAAESAREGHAEALRALLAPRAAESSVPGLAVPLVLAAEHGHVEALDVLLQAGAEPDARQAATGMTPLHLAVKAGESAAVRLLLQNGASRFALDAKSRSVWDMGPLAPEIAQLLAVPDDAPATGNRIAGADVHGLPEMLDTQLTPLPLRFTGMDGRVAILESTSANLKLHVRPGEMISDTLWRLDGVVTEAPAMPAWLLPHVIVTDTRDDQHHLLALGRTAYAPPLRATLQFGSAETLWDTREGDSFVLDEVPHRVTRITRRSITLTDGQNRARTFLLAR